MPVAGGGEVRGEGVGGRPVEALPAMVVAAGGAGVGVAELLLDVLQAGADVTGEGWRRCGAAREGSSSPGSSP